MGKKESVVMKSKTYKLLGRTPGLIMHSNYVLADPLHPVTQRIKQLSTNKKKTDEDILECYRLEFTAGLYVDSDSGKIFLPADNFNSMIREAAAKTPGITGRVAATAISAVEDAEFFHEAPESSGEIAEVLWASNSPSFRLIRPVKLNGKSTVIRSRPIFTKWAASVEISYDPGDVAEAKLDEIMGVAGKRVGLCDWRPSSPKPGKYGRFHVLDGKDKAHTAAAKKLGLS